MLITLGGVDKDNVTSKVLQALKQCSLPADCEIIVVMGANAPWLEEVRTLAQTLPWSTSVMVGVSNMAQLMADSDLAIGAAGATSWERCALGMPTIMIVIADNQRTIAKNLKSANAVECVGEMSELDDLSAVLADIDIKRMSLNAAKICDGSGAVKTAEVICE